MSKRLVIFLIIALITLNLGFIGFAYYKFKTTVNAFSVSADSAANTTVNATNAKNLLKLNSGKNEIPSTDIAGQDLAGVARPRGDVRSAYTQNPNGTATVEYKTMTAANIILSYYRTALAQNNWILQSATSEKIILTTGGQTLTITASTNSNGVTTYTVTR